jgi:hypothetical protein
MKEIKPNIKLLNNNQLEKRESYYRTIFYIVDAHHKNKLDFKDQGSRLSLRYLIRFLDDLHKYRITKEVYNACEKINYSISPSAYLNHNEYRKINKLLKNAKVNDSIQIEHLAGGVNLLIDFLLNPEISLNEISDIEKIKKIHYEYTNCLIKMVQKEKGLNHKTHKDDINKYISY